MMAITTRILSIFVLMVLFNTVLFYFSITTTVIPGLILHFPLIFLVPFTVWFGIWGLISSYLGFFLALTIGGVGSIGLNLLWSFCYFLQPLIPVVAFKYLGASPELRNTRDILILILFGVIANNIAASSYGVLIPLSFRYWPWSIASSIWAKWTIGNIMLTGLFTPAILIEFTSRIKDAYRR